jgi:hypothetical protein
MRKLVVAAVIVILIEACVIFRLVHENRMAQSRVDAVSEELTQARKSAEARESDVRTLGDSKAELEQELSRTTQALSNTITTNIQTSGLSSTDTMPDPLGLTTNDVDLAGMFVVGTNTVGTLFVPIRGKVLERLVEIQKRRQPIVFGMMLSETNGFTGLGGWGEKDGIKVQGLALHFNSSAEAEAFAAQMRAQGGQ